MTSDKSIHQTDTFSFNYQPFSFACCFSLQESLQLPAYDDDLENCNCCICNDGTSDDTNQIVFCDGCDIAVHQGTSVSSAAAVFVSFAFLHPHVFFVRMLWNSVYSRGFMVLPEM